MAYTITLLDGGIAKQYQVLNYLAARMAKEGIFRATLTPSVDRHARCIIIVKPVRLIKAKPYCGNHPGECQINPFTGPQKKPRATYLEWEDWVKFHNLVNRVLNRFRANADVWSTPMDVKGKMWIRKGRKARVNWNWDESFDRYGRAIRIWNQGTPDQFEVA
jgi:hypothetical protein